MTRLSVHNIFLLLLLSFYYNCFLCYITIITEVLHFNFIFVFMYTLFLM